MAVTEAVTTRTRDPCGGLGEVPGLGDEHGARARLNRGFNAPVLDVKQAVKSEKVNREWSMYREYFRNSSNHVGLGAALRAPHLTVPPMPHAYLL